MKVTVQWVKKHKRWSIKREGGILKDKVMSRADHVLLENPHFVISGGKAVIRGDLVNWSGVYAGTNQAALSWSDQSTARATRIVVEGKLLELDGVSDRYTDDQVPVVGAAVAYLSAEKVFAHEPRHEAP